MGKSRRHVALIIRTMAYRLHVQNYYFLTHCCLNAFATQRIFISYMLFAYIFLFVLQTFLFVLHIAILFVLQQQVSRIYI